MTSLEQVADQLDGWTGGWATTYADLYPESPTTPLGIFFLATNLAYSMAGYALWVTTTTTTTTNTPMDGLLLSVLTETASVASFVYHYGQLLSGSAAAASEEESSLSFSWVRIVLVVDYLVAFAAIGTALSCLVTTPGGMVLSWQGWVACSLSLVCLALSWIDERPGPYIVFHGLWHILGAYGGYSVGQAHLRAVAATTATTLLTTTTMVPPPLL